MVWFGLRQHPSEVSVKASSRSDLFWRFYRRFRVGLVWLCMVWGNIHLKILWNFHQDLISFGCFRKDIQLVWIGKVWFGFVLFGMVWFGLIWDNIQLKLLWNFHQDPTCFGCFREDLQLVLFGKVWFGMLWFGMVW